MRRKTTIILGDSFNNTLGLIRSLGEAKAEIFLILHGNDRLFVSKSRYIAHTFKIKEIEEAREILQELGQKAKGAFLVCSNDKAAKWIDENETWLSVLFLTPMRGKRLGQMFKKDEQCRLAHFLGIQVPITKIFKRGAEFPEIEFPLLLKPVDSTKGEKSDIHICHSPKELNQALSQGSKCENFIVQEYIEKDYEINLIGVSTDNGVCIPGGIKKIRHFPKNYGACSFGEFLPSGELEIDVQSISRMIEHIGYKGSFSVELLRKEDKNYFMEVNFRHDGLAYVATASGVNLLKFYIEREITMYYKVRPIFMMDISTDYMYVKNGELEKLKWIKNVMRTRCQLNFNIKDPMPTIYYYLSKLKTK